MYYIKTNHGRNQTRTTTTKKVITISAHLQVKSSATKKSRSYLRSNSTNKPNPNLDHNGSTFDHKAQDFNPIQFKPHYRSISKPTRLEPNTFFRFFCCSSVLEGFNSPFPLLQASEFFFSNWLAFCFLLQSPLLVNCNFAEIKLVFSFFLLFVEFHKKIKNRSRYKWCPQINFPKLGGVLIPPLSGESSSIHDSVFIENIYIFSYILHDCIICILFTLHLCIITTIIIFFVWFLAD